MSESAGNESYNSSGYVTSNAPFTVASALTVRLDMKEEISQFQKYILGIETEIYQNEDGTLGERVVYQGERLVNEKGFQSLMGWISFIMNKHTIMGNFIDEDWYGSFMCDLHKDVWCDLIINREKYGIELRQINALHAKFMMCSRLILTRPIFDNERKGMNSTTRIEERSQTNQANKGFFNIPWVGGRK